MKVTFSWLWAVVLPITLSLHMWKVLLFIFILLSIHETFHIVCAKWFSLKSVEVKVYPIGLSARIKDLEHQKSIYEILITLSGLSVHVICFFLLPLLYKMNLMSLSFMNYLNHINMSILYFNLLPIYPLDGGRILRNILEFIFPYRTAKKLTIIFSIVMILFLGKVVIYNISGVILICFFAFQIGSEIFLYHSHNRDFYLYRYLYGICGNKKIHKHKDIYKNYDNYIFENNRILSERSFLKRFF